MVERLGGDDALAHELVGLFLSDVDRMMGEIRVAAGQGAAEALRRAAHAFKGSVGNFTDGPPHLLAFDLEKAARDGRIESVPAIMARLENEVEAFVAQLEAYERSGA